MPDNGSSSDLSREKAYAIVKELRERYRNHIDKLYQANEAKTRLLIINTVLNALGWSNESFNPEEYAGQVGYTDYLLTIDSVPRMVVEAKRGGQTFREPTTQLKRHTYKLSYLRSTFGSALTEVVEQAEKYVQHYGLPFALVSNGMEWILLQLSLPPGYKDIDDLQCYYFGSLLSEDFQFEMFWELLYEPNVADGRIEEQFAHLNSIEAEFTRAPSVDLGEFRWSKPSGNQYLRDFYSFFFTNITDEARRFMLQKCFVSNSRLDQYQGELNRALRDMSPAYMATSVDIHPDTDQNIFTSASGDNKGTVILITGSVGCGKSTFVAKVLLEARKQQSADLQVYLLIDLINEAVDDNTDQVSRLWETIHERWLELMPESGQYEQLQKIFGRELQILKHGANAKLFERDPDLYDVKEAEELERLSQNSEKFVIAAWKYYRQKKNRGIALFFDNVDKASENYQKQVYTFAHKVAHETGATVLITMREVTFFRGQNGGFLDVRAGDTVYHLQSPNLQQLLSRRIKYVEDYIHTDPRRSEWSKSRNLNEFVTEALNHAGKLKMFS
jgi:hypothetical protein